MPHILLIDDDPNLRTILTKVLVKSHFDVSCAKNGASGIQRAKTLRPDLIILDIIMPDMDGFEVTRQLRADPACVNIPIMALTAFATPRARKAAAEAGMNAFVIKPFSVQEIVALAKTMISTRNMSPDGETSPSNGNRQARLIAIHSLRGGLGCTTLAVNLAFALKKKWHQPTLLLDGDFASGQVAMMLNWQGRLSWSDLLRANAKNAVCQALEDGSIVYEKGLHVLAAPRDPGDADRFSSGFVGHSLNSLRQRYEYIVADLAHDFRDNTFELMKDCEKIFFLLSPDAVSQQLTKKALNTYAAMGIRPANVELILVDIRSGAPAIVSDIEQDIGRSLLANIPYADEMAGATDPGQPLVVVNPRHEISGLVEELASLLGKPDHRNAAKTVTDSSHSRPRPQLHSAGQNGAQNGVGRSLLKQLGLAK